MRTCLLVALLALVACVPTGGGESGVLDGTGTRVSIVPSNGSSTLLTVEGSVESGRVTWSVVDPTGRVAVRATVTAGVDAGIDAGVDAGRSFSRIVALGGQGGQWQVVWELAGASGRYRLSWSD